MKKKIIVQANPKQGAKAEAHQLRANIRNIISSIPQRKIKSEPLLNGLVINMSSEP